MAGRILRFSGALAVCLGLAACVEGTAGGGSPDASGGVIEWSSGGAFSGASGERIYANDLSVSWMSEPFGQEEAARRQLKPGTYDRALAWLRANPLKGRDVPTGPACPDYGTDAVTWTGPGPAIRYVAGCPGSKVPDLQDRLLAVIRAAQQ